jgi:hypothetical protein
MCVDAVLAADFVKPCSCSVVLFLACASPLHSCNSVLYE